MSNVNDYEFSKYLESFRSKVLVPQIVKTEDARKIIEDPNYKWASEDQKKRGEAQYANYKDWKQFYQAFFDAGTRLVNQHENLVNLLSKWYDKWYDDISNEGKQESEMMSMQADMLNEIFCEIFKELQPLNLDIKPPLALNMK